MRNGELTAFWLGLPVARPHMMVITLPVRPMTVYPDYRYDRHGQLIPPFWFWPITILLTRSLWLFVMAAASRGSGADMLALLYPDRTALYLAMASDLPAALALLACGSGLAPWRAWLRRQTRTLMLLSAMMGLALQLLSLNQLQWAFSWPSAGVLIGSLWALLYLAKSRELRDYARDRPSQ